MAMAMVLDASKVWEHEGCPAVVGAAVYDGVCLECESDVARPGEEPVVATFTGAPAAEEPAAEPPLSPARQRALDGLSAYRAAWDQAHPAYRTEDAPKMEAKFRAEIAAPMPAIPTEAARYASDSADPHWTPRAGHHVTRSILGRVPYGPSTRVGPAFR